MGEGIRVDGEGAVVSIVFDRSERLNALTLTMLQEIREACHHIASTEARIVILRGEGSSFSAGMDLETFREGPLLSADPDRRYDAAALGRSTSEAIAGLPQVTIAALHGHVYGGGVVLAASCDILIAEEDAIFSIPEIDVGIPLAWGGIELLVRSLGPARTKELVMTGRTFTAAEAYTWGLVNTVAPSGQALEEATKVADTVASKARFAITTTKRHVAEVAGGDHSRDDALGLVAAFEDSEAAARRREYLDRFTR
ncbi:MAG TPA: enoyl-CoA hydratase/isomerase family protein [Acidimicrobiia bacterium]|nr:enoyl-CoA hydratase/isomerase family protein [Acidimicrobiia bacterium]